MRPVLFRWRGHQVSSYAALLYLGIVAGIAVGNVASRRNGLPGGRVYLAMIVLLPLALLGARLAYVLGHPAEFRAQPGLMFRRSVGGQAMLGGLVVVPISAPLMAALRVPFWSFWDVATFTMLTGMVFARVGCLLNGCCSGRPTTGRLGLVLPDVRGVRRRRIPMQLLEGVVALGLLVLAAVLNELQLVPGSVLLVILAAYGAIRIVLQGFRDDRSTEVRPSMQRLAAACMVVVALSSVSLRGL